MRDKSSMNRTLRIIAVFVFISAAGVVLWMPRTRSVKPSPKASIKDTVYSAMTNPASFAKNRFTGGVGAALTVDKTNGNPLIMHVMPGSPAEAAGLLAGDHILQVDGVATSGRTLAQNVESIRGFSAGHVTLTVQRSGSTNLECVIQRTSWKNLGVPQ
jgi:C-terminal processing protease CtpA/Prc